jgi:hypothetical protein
MAEAIGALGYPGYFLKLLAAAKLAGVAAIVSGHSVVLKEWAYAGFTFEATAAIASFLSTASTPFIAALPLAFLVVQLASYACWKRLAARSDTKQRVRSVLPASSSAMRGYY